MDRRNFIKSASGVVLLAGATPWPEALAKTLSKSPDGKRPMNLLFMTADDMNGSMPGWMGNPLKPTPNMDAFAATAHRFVDNHDAAPICQPSREAMMTGLWPQRSGALGFNPINMGVPTLATVLKEKGYFIAAFNKLSHMEPAYCFPWDYSMDDSGRNPPMIEDQVAEAIKRARAQGKPFFLNCNMRDPHRPWPRLNPMRGAPQEGERWIRAGSPIDDVTNKITPEQVTVPSFLEDLPPIREELATYHNAVQRLDLGFGKAMAALQASGEMDNTIILFVSDHGMPFPFSKATCYRNGSWCPATIRWPGMGSPRTFSEMTQSTDIMPTVLDLLGVEKPEMDGRSWMPLIRGEKQENRDYIINNVNGVYSGDHQFPMRVVQTKKSAFIITLMNKFQRLGCITRSQQIAVGVGFKNPRVSIERQWVKVIAVRHAIKRVEAAVRRKVPRCVSQMPFANGLGRVAAIMEKIGGQRLIQRGPGLRARAERSRGIAAQAVAPSKHRGPRRGADRMAGVEMGKPRPL